jgi:hypothetical protein
MFISSTEASPKTLPMALQKRPDRRLFGQQNKQKPWPLLKVYLKDLTRL